MPALPDVKDQQGAKGRWSDFYLRTVSAAVLGPVVLFCLWRGGLAWTLLMGVVMVGLGHEWGKLAKLRNPWFLAAVLLLIWVIMLTLGVGAALLAVLLFGLAVWASFGRMAAIGVPYAGIGGVLLMWLRHRYAVGLVDAAFLILVIWGTDIGAYLAGRLIGGPKLAPRISPGKTWSGAVGGTLIGALIGAILAFFTRGAAVHALGAAVLISCCAQSGDLMESAIKRRLGVKDSGRTIPGHGGLFDRLDGFLTAVPLAAVMAAYVHGGVALWG